MKRGMIMIWCHGESVRDSVGSNLESAPGVGRPVLAPELLQLLLQLLLPPPPHDGLGVADGPGEGSVRKLWGGRGLTLTVIHS